MEKVIFILGKQGCGKTTLAQKIGKESGKKNIYTIYKRDAFCNTSLFGREIDYDCDCLILEDCEIKDITKLNHIIQSENITIRPPFFKTPFEIIRPLTIIESSTIKKEEIELKDHYEIIEL
jgi:uridine kinase